VKPIPPLSTSIDLDNIESIELRTADDRHVGSYYLKMTEELRELYNEVERVLSHALQPEITSASDKNTHIIHARDSLRKIMRKMGWKGQF